MGLSPASFGTVLYSLKIPVGLFRDDPKPTGWEILFFRFSVVVVVVFCHQAVTNRSIKKEKENCSKLRLPIECYSRRLEGSVLPRKSRTFIKRVAIATITNVSLLRIVNVMCLSTKDWVSPLEVYLKKALPTPLLGFCWVQKSFTFAVFSFF